MAPRPVARTRGLVVLCAAIAALALLSACGNAATGSSTAPVEDGATIAGRPTTSTVQIEDWEGLSRGPYSVGISHASGGNPIVKTYPGVREIVSFTIGNYGDLPDSYKIEVTSSSPLIDVTGVPRTLALDPGETYELRLGLGVPFDLEDGPMGKVEIAVTSQNSSSNVGRCTVTVEIEKPTIAD